MTKTEKISGGYPRVAQAMLLIFFLPFVLILFLVVMSKNFTVEGLFFLSIFLIAISFVLKFVFSYADVYLLNSTIITKKLFTKKQIALDEIKSIDESFFPFTFYIKTEKVKIYFLPNTKDLTKQLISLDPKKGLDLIRAKSARND